MTVTVDVEGELPAGGGGEQGERLPGDEPGEEEVERGDSEKPAGAAEGGSQEDAGGEEDVRGAVPRRDPGQSPLSPGGIQVW